MQQRLSGHHESVGNAAPRPSGPLMGVALMVLACLALAGCSDEAANYQFATDPRNTRVAATPVATQPLSPVSPVKLPAATPVSLAELLAPRGAPDRVYFLRDGQLWAVSTADGSAGRIYAPPAGRRIGGYDHSPSGNRVAVALASGSGSTATTDVVLLDGSGKTERAVRDLTASLGIPPSAPTSVSWSPQGSSVLVGLETGGIVSLPVEKGSPTLLLAPEADHRPEGAEWSPTGEEFAFLDRTAATGHRDLFLTAASGTPTVPRKIAPQSGDASVEQFAWLPSGQRVLFTEAGGPLGGQTTDLWEVAPDGNDRRLVAPAGIAAPVAQVTNFAPSSDGKSVAYSIDVPSAKGMMFDSLWIKDLESGRSLQVPLPEGLSVSDLWWTANGLVLRAVDLANSATPRPTGSVSNRLLIVGPDGAVRELLRFTEAAAATPVAVPARGTPAATPLARP